MAAGKVELICKNEQKVVATVEVDGKFDAALLQRTMIVLDKLRSPEAVKIEDGKQMFCKRCFGVLYVRGVDGKLFAACPGTLEIHA